MRFIFEEKKFVVSHRRRCRRLRRRCRRRRRSGFSLAYIKDLILLKLRRHRKRLSILKSSRDGSEKSIYQQHAARR